jgi:hypothetical protein
MVIEAAKQRNNKLIKEVHMSRELTEYFNKMPRLATLSTAGKDGKVNAAYFGSPKMVGEKTVFMSLRNNRTFANLQENPYAVFVIMEPGKTMPEWKGVRVYMKMTDCQTSGPKLEELKAQTAQRAGAEVANLVYAAVTFEIYEVRPFVDAGQKWEDSI